MKPTRPILSAFALLASLLPLSQPATATACSATLCAGAASADITPPVTTPMWGYTARQGLLFTGAPLQTHLEQAGGHLQAANPEAAAGEVVAGASEIPDARFVRDKTSGDVEGYDKEFVANRGVHLRLQANAFVLQGSNGLKAAVVQTDLGGVPGEVHQAVADRIAATGIARDRLLIGATHSHHGPGGIFQSQGYALLGGDEFDPRVFEAVVAGISNAILRADARLAPARLGVKRVALPGASRQRRTAQWCRNPESLCAGDQPTPASPPAHDADATVIRVDTAAGLPLGAITSFAAHGTIGGDSNLLFSGDNQGWATRLVVDGIEAAAGPLPSGHEVVNALVNAAQGDVSPAGDGFNDYSEMEDSGHRQAPGVLAAWSDLGDELTGDIVVDGRFSFLCFCGQSIRSPHRYDGPLIDKTDPVWDRVAPYAMLGNGDIVAPPGTSSPVVFPAQGHKAPLLAGAGLVPSIVRLQVLRIGPLLFAAIPGEPNVTVGRRLAATLSAQLAGHANAPSTVLVAGLANDYISYFATPEEYTAHRYEGSFTLFGPQSAPLLEQEFTRLTAALLAGTPAPACDPTISAEDCLAHIEHPNTSATALQPVAADLGGQAAVLAPPAAAVPRLGVAEMTWAGGGPSVEWRPDEDRVILERSAGGDWIRVAGDARGTATVLLYEKADGVHRWTARWDVPAGATLGRYRLRVEGRTREAGVFAAGYSLAGEFDVVAAASLVVGASQSGTTLTVTAAYPYDPARSFRRRAAVDGTAFVTVMRSGSPVEVSAPMTSGTAAVALQAGDVVDTVRAVDVYGNAGTRPRLPVTG